MKVKNIGSNQTEVTTADGVHILVSYETPVAAWINGQFYKTDRIFSKTTTKHINKWAGNCTARPQAFFEGLLKGDK